MFLTRRGFLLACAFVVIPLLFEGWTSFWVALGLLAALLLIDVALTASPKQVLVERRLPRTARLGEDAPASVLLRNPTNRRMRGVFSDGWSPAAGLPWTGSEATGVPVDLPASERRAFSSVLRPTRRGDISTAHVTLRVRGPLGLVARQATLPAPGSIKVLPPFNSRRQLASKLQRLRELDGRAAVQIRGAGTEFDSLRDYVRGDDVRSIDWRATARKQDVVVRTWRPERDRRVVLVLDTSRTSAARIDDEPRLDTGMEACLLLSVLAERGGDRVEFLAYDRRQRARVSSAAKGNLLGHLVEAMATLEPELIEADWSRIPTQVRQISGQHSLVVLVTALDSGAVEEGLLPVLPALTARHTVVIAAVRDPELERWRHQHGDAAEVYRAGAAERSLQLREALKNELRSMGAEVVDAAPHELPGALADCYIRLKATGRL